MSRQPEATQTCIQFLSLEWLLCLAKVIAPLMDTKKVTAIVLTLPLGTLASPLQFRRMTNPRITHCHLGPPSRLIKTSVTIWASHIRLIINTMIFPLPWHIPGHLIVQAIIPNILPSGSVHQINSKWSLGAVIRTAVRALTLFIYDIHRLLLSPRIWFRLIGQW